MNKEAFLGFVGESTAAETRSAAGVSQETEAPTAGASAAGGAAAPFPVEKGLCRIPAGTQQIPAEMFRGRKDVTIVEFQDMGALRSIGRAAFSDCENLAEIRFLGMLPQESPDKNRGGTCSLKEIGDDAFRRCRSLRLLYLPEGVERLGDDCFSGCGALEALYLPKTLKSIGRGAFSFCFRLRYAEIPASVEKIGREAFYLSRRERDYVELDFGERKDFSGIDPDVLRTSHRCPRCGRPLSRLARRCVCQTRSGR